MTTETAKISPAVIEALAIAGLPDIAWGMHDDLCDCVYQRIGMFTNPYLAETLEIRLCCIWAEIYKAFPQFARTIPAFWDYNAEEWVTEPQEWNGEDDMPAAIWHRQLARKEGISVAEARAKGLPAPKGTAVKAPVTFFLPLDGDWLPVELARAE